MILTVKNGNETLFAISNNTIIQVHDDWKGIVELWLSRGVRFVSLHYKVLVCKPNSKAFLNDLKVYMQLNFPDFECQLTEQT
jgi:hypothetical protein